MKHFNLWNFWLEKNELINLEKVTLRFQCLLESCLMSIFWQSRTQRDNGDGLFKIINQPKRKIRTVESLGKKFYQWR